jgi:hypothetical protein
MFRDLEQFVNVHHPCGELSSNVGKLTDVGYVVHLACTCGAAFEQWITSKMADHDLLHSRLLAFPN